MEEDTPTSQHADGYTRLADFMAWDPPTAIFSRFHSANALNLLYLQAEICELQEDLAIIATTEEQLNPLDRQSQVDWSALKESTDGTKGRKELLLELRSRLSDYNVDNALIQQATLSQLSDPLPDDLQQLQNWLKDKFHGGSSLRGPGSTVWSSNPSGREPCFEFVSIWPRQRASDRITRWILALFPWITSFKWITGPDILKRLGIKKRKFPGRTPFWLGNQPAKDFEIYSNTASIIRAGNIVATVLCCLAIVVPIVILNYVKPTAWRLFIIAVSTVIFSTVLAMSSDATRKDIFAATAAFAAVQVVYVGSNS